jgi:hypothetical protein
MNEVGFMIEPEFHIIHKTKKAASKFHLPVRIGFPDKRRIAGSNDGLPKAGLRVSQITGPGEGLYAMLFFLCF